MAVVVYAKAARTAARHVDTRKKVRNVRDGVTRRAKSNLLAANTTSRITEEGYFPAQIQESEKIEDDHEKCYTILFAPNALALEFGHAPSGAFGEGGKFEGRQTSPTPATYILTAAAIGGTPS